MRVTDIAMAPDVLKFFGVFKRRTSNSGVYLCHLSCVEFVLMFPLLLMSFCSCDHRLSNAGDFRGLFAQGMEIASASPQNLGWSSASSECHLGSLLDDLMVTRR